MSRIQEDMQRFFEQVTLQTEEVVDSVLEALEKTVADVEQGLDGFDDFIEPIVHDFENQLDDLLVPIVADLETDLETFEQSLEEWASPLTQQLRPLIDQQPACIGCRHYHGESYGGTFLVCGMHPYGVQTESCPDWEAC